MTWIIKKPTIISCVQIMKFQGKCFEINNMEFMKEFVYYFVFLESLNVSNIFIEAQRCSLSPKTNIL